MIESLFDSSNLIRHCNFDYITMLNQSQYEVVDTLQFDLKVPKLYPIISLYPIINKLALNRLDTGEVNIICKDNPIGRRVAFSKLRVLNYLFYSTPEANILKKTSFGTVEYVLGTGMIRDLQQNTLLSFCFDISKVDFVGNKILEGGLYLMLDIQRLSTPENKQLLSIINSKGSVMDICIENNIDVIFTSKIDRKLFTVFNKEFTSIMDRKSYLQEKSRLLIEENIDDVVI